MILNNPAYYLVYLALTQVPVHIGAYPDLRPATRVSFGSAVQAERDGPLLGRMRLAEAGVGRDPLAGFVQVNIMFWQTLKHVHP